MALERAFFFHARQKTQGKKTQATKKLKHFFSQKLNVPEDFSKVLAKNSIFTLFFWIKSYQETTKNALKP